MNPISKTGGMLLLALWTLPAAHAQLTFVTNNGAITITGYTGPAGPVVIPASTNGRPVVSINTSAFIFSSTVLSLSIPDSVTNIGPGICNGCTSVTNVTIGNGVQSIGNGAFYGCSALTTFSMGGSNINIPDVMFANCGNLIRLTLPQNILSTGNSSFYKCTGLTNAPIGTNIVSIGYGSFSYDSGLTNINFPGTLTSIGDIAFYQCTGLTSLTLPNSVLTVGSESFYSCVGLTNIVLDTNLTSIGTYAFWTCPYFTSIVIPDSVTNMGDYAFYGCTNLAHVKLSTNLANIPNWAFTYCNIPSIVIPACVTNIGDYALGGFYFVTTSLYFAGNAPTQGLGVLQGDTFGTTVYYLPGTTGWSSSFATYPTTLWNPLANTADGLFGIRTNRFGFNITGNSGLAVVVEGCTNLSHPNWIPLSTNVLLGGTSYFSDPASTSFPARFYGFTFP